MDSLIIYPTRHTPEVNFDALSGTLVLKGGSIPENTYEFFEPILEWIDRYVENPQYSTILDVHLTYFNTTSSKHLLEMFRKMEVIHKKGKEVLVKWYYISEEEDMLEAGNDYRSIVKIPFEVIEIR